MQSDSHHAVEFTLRRQCSNQWGILSKRCMGENLFLIDSDNRDLRPFGHNLRACNLATLVPLINPSRKSNAPKTKAQISCPWVTATIHAVCCRITPKGKSEHFVVLRRVAQKINATIKNVYCCICSWTKFIFSLPGRSLRIAFDDLWPRRLGNNLMVVKFHAGGPVK